MVQQLTNLNQEVIAGDTVAIAIPVRDDAGALLDVSSGYTAIWVAQTTDGVTTIVDSNADTPVGIAAPTMGNGSVTLTLTSALSATLAAGRYNYEVELTETVGTVVTTIAKGAFTVRSSIAGAGAA